MPGRRNLVNTIFCKSMSYTFMELWRTLIIDCIGSLKYYLYYYFVLEVWLRFADTAGSYLRLTDNSEGSKSKCPTFVKVFVLWSVEYCFIKKQSNYLILFYSICLPSIYVCSSLRCLFIMASWLNKWFLNALLANGLQIFVFIILIGNPIL